MSKEKIKKENQKDTDTKSIKKVLIQRRKKQKKYFKW